MPTIQVKKELLMQQLGRQYKDEEFDELCFAFGIELDEITSEKKMALKEKGTIGQESDDVIYKIDLPANRYDLLSLEGLALALRIFIGLSDPPNYKVKPSGLEFKVDENIRPVLLGAIVRGIKLNENLYSSFIDLLDKIHQNIGRKGTIVTILTHDLDKIQGSPLPPTIKADVSLNTENMLIEIRATDREKATIALDTVVSMLVSSTGNFEAESVLIKHADGRVYTTPDMSYHRETIKRDYINQGLGLNLGAQDIANLLTKMSLKAKVLACGEEIEVYVPPTRHDIIHKCDVMEDVGIAYGYDNITKTLPKSATIATQFPLNKVSDQLRHEISRCGYTEALNFALCSEDELSTMLRRPKLNNLVGIKNPKTIEFQVARTCLLSGLLKTINSNKKMPLPMKLFEVSDVVFSDSSREVGAKNERHLAAIYYGKQSSGFEMIHGLLDRIMQVLDIPYIGDLKDKNTLKQGYYIEAAQDEAFIDGRCAAVIYNGTKIGYLGILHPEVLSNFELNHPSSALEITIEKFPFI